MAWKTFKRVHILSIYTKLCSFVKSHLYAAFNFYQNDHFVICRTTILEVILLLVWQGI